MHQSILGLRLTRALALTTLLFSSTVPGAEITVGANIGNVPWEFQDESGAYVGFEIDLVTEVAARLGADLEIVNIPFSGLFSAVQSGMIDIAISSITVTDRRLESVAFVRP